MQDTALAECQGPAISNVRVYDVSAHAATIAFVTDEPTTARVRCGLTAGGPFTVTKDDALLRDEHIVRLTDLQVNTPYYFVVEAWDRVGNPATDDGGGSGYRFRTLALVYCFPMDTDPGWTTEGLWQFGVPTGAGSFNHDPTVGHTGANVFGYNLAGDYENLIPVTRPGDR